MFMFHIHHLEPSEIELKERSFIYTSYLLLIETNTMKLDTTENALGNLAHNLQRNGKLPTYPSPKLTLTLTSHLGQNDGLGEG